ncbi:MAG: LptF/LptG family permease [Verrucomicrobiota bacterium]|nr:LptF/LptG family permease [Verrucomicrobiota bacterium]
MKLWQRYLLTHLWAPFLFILLSLSLLYIAIDLSLHSSLLSEKSPSLFLYYLHEWSRFLDLFVFTAFFLALLKQRLELQKHREFLALGLAGLSRFSLLTPSLWSSLFLLFLSYANNEWLLPSTYLSSSKESPRVSSLLLSDNSELIYQSYDEETETLFDLFWIRSQEEIWAMETLHLPSLSATKAELFLMKEGITKESVLLPRIPLEKSSLLLSLLPLEKRPLSELLRASLSQGLQAQKNLACLSYKLTLPTLLFSLLFLPFAPHFFPLLLSALLALSARILLDSLLILSENQLLPSFAPFLLLLLIPLFSLAFSPKNKLFSQYG